ERHVRALGHEPIDGIGLIRRADHERVEQKLQPLRGVSLEDVVVETVKSGDATPADQREDAALGRVRVDVTETLEVGGISEVAESGKAVLRVGSGGSRLAEKHTGEKRRSGEGADPPQDFEAPGSFAALSSSYHQTCMKPGVSAGKVCGCPKRF